MSFIVPSKVLLENRHLTIVIFISTRTINLFNSQKNTLIIAKNNHTLQLIERV